MRLSEHLFRQSHVRTAVLTGYDPNSILSIILRPAEEKMVEEKINIGYIAMTRMFDL